jgi:uncharacterized DUF497 family protein
VEIEFDLAKSAKNASTRGLPFDLVMELAWDEALIVEDARRDCSEKRLLGFAPMGGRLHVVCYWDYGDTCFNFQLFSSLDGSYPIAE